MFQNHVSTPPSAASGGCICSIYLYEVPISYLALSVYFLLVPLALIGVSTHLHESVSERLHGGRLPRHRFKLREGLAHMCFSVFLQTFKHVC